MANWPTGGRSSPVTAYTIADITALCGIDFGRISGIRIGERPHLARWHAAVSARPSAQA